MEFDDLGDRCALKDCNRLIYLSYICKFCNKSYCFDHKDYEKHNCQNYNNIKNETKKNKIKTFKCHICNKKNLYELKCSICNKDVCLIHRYQENHICIENNLNIVIKKKKRCIIF